MKNNIFRFIRYCLLGILPGILLISCSEMDDTYEDFIKDGEVIYTGKPDSLTAFSGNKRIKVAFDLVSDPKINKVRIYWNNPVQYGEHSDPNARPAGRDSIEIPVVRSAGVDHIESVIDKLQEGVYTFELYSYDVDGNSSVRTEVIGEVYGETYQNSIANRPLDKATYLVNNNSVQLDWFGAGQQSVIVEIVYTNIAGTEQKAFTKKVLVDPRKPPVFLERSFFDNCKAGTGFKYRTGFLPNTTAIDTFYTAYKEVAADELAAAFSVPDYFKIVAKHSGKALMVQDASTSNGGLVVQSDFINDPEYIWKLTKNTDDYYVFTNVNSGRDMGVKSASTDDGAVILQWSQGSNTNDEWSLEPVDASNRYFQIINRKSGKAITAIDALGDEGAGFEQRTWSGADHQQFEIIPVRSATPPAAPSHLTAVVVSSQQIDLSWSDNSDNEYFFRIERSTDGESWSSIATVKANSTTYSSKGLSPLTTYYYRVRSENTHDEGNSDYSAVASATTPDIQVKAGVNEAEGLKLSGFQTEDDFNGEDVAKPSSKDITGSMSGVFSGVNGSYDVSLRFWDENDGQVTFTLKINGISQGSTTLNADDNAWHTWTWSGVSINDGDVVSIEGSQNSGEHGRVDRLEIN